MSEPFDASRPIYAQLVERLKAKILAGIYPPGGHLDSVRDLAAAVGVNPNTMQRALAQLETEETVLIDRLRAATAEKIAAEFLEKMQGIGYSPAQVAELLTQYTKEDANHE